MMRFVLMDARKSVPYPLERCLDFEAARTGMVTRQELSSHVTTDIL